MGDYDYLYKVVLVGDSVVGKSSLLMRFTKNEFNNMSMPTIGVEFDTRTIEINGKKVKIQIWDTAGPQRFRTIISAYYRGAVGCILVFDISKRDSFSNIEKWLKEIKEHCESKTSLILVGNKSDRSASRVVSLEESKAFAENNNMLYIETSCLDNINVDIVFEKCAKDIFFKLNEINIEQKSILKKPDVNKWKSSLTCPYCLKIYKNPVELPCKDSICEVHLTEKDVVKKNKIVCAKCNQEFEVKGNEFTSGNLVKQLLETQVYLNNDEINLKKKIEESIKLFYEMYDEFTSSKTKLDLECHNHFQEIRFQLDQHREQLKEQIDDIYMKMIEDTKVIESSYLTSLNDKLETSCLKSFEARTVTEKLNEIEEKFRDPNLGISSIREMILKEQEIIDELKTIQSEITQVKEHLKISNNFKPNFNFDVESFGSLFLDEYFNKDPFKSKIFSGQQQVSELMKVCEFYQRDTFKLLYRASQDGFGSNDFHSKCDNKSKTLTIFKASESSNIFGGFTSVAWESPLLGSGKCKSDPNAFLFSLTNIDNKACKMKIKPIQHQHAIYCHSEYGPTFGFASPDIFIKSNANETKESYSCLGNTYKHPQYAYGTNEAQSFLAGSYLFQLSEIEVYQKE